ncbi:hypothetical protein D9M68_877630 [compost metagenome]
MVGWVGIFPFFLIDRRLQLVRAARERQFQFLRQLTTQLQSFLHRAVHRAGEETLDQHPQGDGNR